jgi:hypothetical protein
MEKELLLPEKLYLLSIRPNKGGRIGEASSPGQYSLIATILKELEYQGNIKIAKNRVEIVSFANNDPLFAFVLSKFRKFDDPLKITRWFNRLYYSLSYIKKELVERLMHKRLVRVEQRKFLFFTWKVPCLEDTVYVRNMADKVRNSIFKSHREDIEKFLLGMLIPAGILPRLFSDRQQRKNASRHLKRMQTDCPITLALRRIIVSAHATVAS